MDRQQISRWVDATEVPMLVAAGAAVFLYLVDLAGGWAAVGLVEAHQGLALALDLLFVADLLVKIAVQRAAYLRTPWFAIDLICAAPVLSTLAWAPGALQGMRLMRLLRILRVLRMLRVLRTLRVLNRMADRIEDTPEQRRWHRVLTGSVLAYSAAFLGLVHWARGGPDPDRAELTLVLGALASLALMLVLARYQVPALFSRQVRALLNVALPEQVARWMIDHPDEYDRTVRMPATVIFCDIKGFTRSAEQLELDELKRHLEEALEVVVQAHRHHDLIIDKFIGDAVMSFRGGDIAGGPPEEIAWRVVRAALDGQRALARMEDRWFREIKIGGASSDAALIGAFGTSARLSYTVLGDKVNLAARLEAACSHLGVPNLFDDTTRQLTRDRADLAWRRVGMLRVQGRVGVANAWEAFDAGDDTAWFDRYHRALEAVEERRFDEAIAGFEAVLQERPEDGPSRCWRAACQGWIQGVGRGWQPVLETRK